MTKIIVIAGATGNLGGKIVNALIAKGAEVRAIVRLKTDPKKIEDLEKKVSKFLKQIRPTNMRLQNTALVRIVWFQP